MAFDIEELKDGEEWPESELDQDKIYAKMKTLVAAANKEPNGKRLIIRWRGLSQTPKGCVVEGHMIERTMHGEVFGPGRGETIGLYAPIYFRGPKHQDENAIAVLVYERMVQSKAS